MQLDFFKANQKKPIDYPSITAPIVNHPEDQWILSRLNQTIKTINKSFNNLQIGEAQEKLWNFNPDPQFISHPQKGSPHSRGVALDLTLLKNNKNLDMGTPFDSFSEKSFHETIILELKQKKIE